MSRIRSKNKLTTSICDIILIFSFSFATAARLPISKAVINEVAFVFQIPLKILKSATVLETMPSSERKSFKIFFSKSTAVILPIPERISMGNNSASESESTPYFISFSRGLTPSGQSVIIT
jgi:hypothetical protein